MSKALRRIAGVSASLLAIGWPASVHGQGANAQDVTQSIFDQHRGADPTNSERALVDKNRKSEARIEQAPLPSSKKVVVNKKVLNQIHELRKQREVFVQKSLDVKTSKQATEKTFAETDLTREAKRATKTWENSEAGRRLQNLEAEAKRQASVKQTTEANINATAIPSRSR